MARTYPCVDPTVDRHVVDIEPDSDGMIVVRVDGLACPHKHRTKAAAERCFFRWNDLEVERHRG